jgi:signal peptidase I
MMRATENRELIEIAEHAISAGQSVRMVAGGWSMFPFFRPRDVLTIAPVNIQEINAGELVVFRRDGRWIAHRVIRIQKSETEITLVTCGDGCLFSDEPISEGIFVGRVIAMSRDGHSKSIVLSDYYHRVMRIFGRLLRPIFWSIKKVLLRLNWLK